MKLAIGLMTCGREEYTRQTLESFSAMNGKLQGVELLHVDDASRSDENTKLAFAHGFETVGSCGPRQGQMRRFDELTSAALARRCDTFLLLENDWLWKRPLAELPGWPEGVTSIRLYGQFKGDKDSRPAGTLIMGTRTPIEWAPYIDGWEQAAAHWGGPPSLTKLEPLREAAAASVTFKGISLRTGHFLSLRPVENFVSHIGHVTTPGFLP